jgi:hypothetical protein
MFPLISLKVLGLRIAHTQTASSSSSSQLINLPSKKHHQKISHQKTPCPPSSSLLYPMVNKEVEQQFSGGVWHCNKRNLPSYFSGCKQLRKSSCAAFCLLVSSAAGAVPNSACRSLSTTVLMSSSHRLLIIHSPHWYICNFNFTSTFERYV